MPSCASRRRGRAGRRAGARRAGWRPRPAAARPRPTGCARALAVLDRGRGRRRSTTPTRHAVAGARPWTTGCAPTAATGAAAIRWTRPATQDVTCEVADRPARPACARPTPTAAQAEFLAGPRHRRAGGRRPGAPGRRAPTSATSRRFATAAASTRPPPSPTRPASARSASSSGTSDAARLADRPVADRTIAPNRASRPTDSNRGTIMTEPAIEAFYSEDRTFPPPPEFVAARPCHRPTRCTRRPSADWQAFWARQARGAARLVEPTVDTMLEWELPFAKWFVGGHAQRRRQLPRPPRRGRPRRPGRLPLGGRAGRHPHDHLRRAARRGAALRQRAQGPRRQQGRPGQRSTCR